ncbi:MULTISPECIES: diaminopimelate epimerase [unclassified Janthinobacterium]|uniref:diaminopimelate epimerase n=1 Tax=unclassified Janthinobacterium TaxID=2610881 RepID=UPI000874BAC5|nr:MULTISPECIES: diaminopimelate epimerase [unclassified Janthinobacterium]MCC7699451.1 diaminopimelate epimerase [Janthinobacterium sp. EB271-G4-7A]OEZ49712.1 diaminopimelate epimerase [Janthinobacterium sp. MP5059B]PHV47908.1 diaminopimelate epimerase [Janthinobacterium sp. BJB301]
MKLQFTKMHGAGNDFIVIDAIHQDIDFTPAQWQRLADRRFGIGADQILVVEKPRLPGCDFRYRIYNNDGGEVEQCGNGARAFVKFVSEKGLSSKDSIRVETMAGVIAPRLEPDGSITVDMGAPVLDPALVPFDANGLDGVAQGNDTLWPLDLALPGQTSPVLVSVVSMGNPHAVQVVEDVDAQDLEVTGPRIEHHPRFPRRVNAGYMQIVDRQHVKLRVFERGAGETLACGTGACAAAVAGILRGLLDSPVRISARGGELSIAWQGDGHPVLMTGPAVTVFEGTIEL